MSTLICRSERRRKTVRQHAQLNGLDYLEVDPEPHILTVFFLGKAPQAWWEKDAQGNPKLKLNDLLPYLRIQGGQRIRGLKVQEVLELQHNDLAELDDSIKVRLDRSGDFSTYTFRVVDGHDKQGDWKRHPKFDARYDRVEFSFKVDCPTDLDCKQTLVCPPEPRDEPVINYLAKDYTSFRQLILDRLAVVMPEWQERHAPDLGIALVEVLAYAGDHLSYYQDAVATEAYLNTARQRSSVRRHARLLDYVLHEGCNARTWVCVGTDSVVTLEPRDVYFVTRLESFGLVVKDEELRQAPSDSYEILSRWPLRKSSSTRGSTKSTYTLGG